MTSRNDTPHKDVPAAPEPSLDEALDEALKESFPASDPIAIHRPEQPL